MKKIISLLLLICIISSVFCTTAFTDEQVVSVYVDGEKLIFDVEPIVENGRTLVPIRAISEYLKYEVDWDNEKWEAEIKNDDNTMVIGVGETAYTSNGETKEMDVPARLVNGRTLVPLRLIAENFGCNVKWVAEEYAAYIETKKENDETVDINAEELFEDYPPDFDDYSNGSINNPLAADNEYGKYRDYEFLSYQPDEMEEEKGIRFFIHPTLGGTVAQERMEYTIGKDNAQCGEGQSWRVYIVEVEYIVGSEELNLNEVFSRENFYNQFGEKHNIYGYYLFKSYGAEVYNKESSFGQLITEENPLLLNSKEHSNENYTELVILCILGDENPEEILLRLKTAGGTKSTWTHINYERKEKKLEKRVFNGVDVNYPDFRAYAINMKIKQLELKKEYLVDEISLANQAKKDLEYGKWIVNYDVDLVDELMKELEEIDIEIEKLKKAL